MSARMGERVGAKLRARVERDAQRENQNFCDRGANVARFSRAVLESSDDDDEPSTVSQSAINHATLSQFKQEHEQAETCLN